MRLVHLPQCCMASAAHVDSPAPDAGLDAVGETRMVPDLATLRQLPWRESSYVALADMRTESGGYMRQGASRSVCEVPNAPCKDMP